MNKKKIPDLCVKIEKVMKIKDLIFWFFKRQAIEIKTKDMLIPCLIAFEVDIIIGQV